MTQEPDDAQGNYYVSIIDGTRRGLLAGPFPNDHAGALAAVDRVRGVACRLDPKAWFYAYGTCRLPLGTSPPGRLNNWLDGEADDA